MTPQQGQLALVRASDPPSSRDGQRRARTGTQKATILSLLALWEGAFGRECVSVTADMLHERHSHTQRSVWSTRLAAMAKPDVGLLEQDRTTNPVSYSLTDAGREAARFLRSAS